MDYASFLKRTRVLFCIQNQLARECLAELLAIFVLIVSGAGGGRGAGVGAEHGGLTAPGLPGGGGGLCWDGGDPKPTHLWLGPRLRFTTAQLLFYHQGNRIIEP